MNRNQNSHFSQNPEANIQRSRFKRNQSVKLSFNAGDLIPFYVDEVLPGDTMSVDTSKLVRMQTLATPVMDDIYLDVYYFFVPNRLIWDHWKNFMGENTSAPWYPDVEYSVPQVTAPNQGGWYAGTIADYMGVPVGVNNLSISALPFRAYGLIWNEWFRDENLITPQSISTNDATQGGSNTDNGLYQAISGGAPLKVAKYHDYFTSALPAPQKGPDVLLPLGTMAPVLSLKQAVSTSNENLPPIWPMSFNRLDGEPITSGLLGVFNGSGKGDVLIGTDSSFSSNRGELVPNNLWTDLTQATAATINQLRLAFQIQKIYEKDARGGTRYIEVIANHFGVTSPDSRLQRPEYLGGNRMAINVNQVVQNSESATTPQGTTTAYSLTVDTNSDFTHSFVEHGYLIGVMCARYDHTYQQGLERFWSRKSRFDFYWPTLANIGEQPILNKEIYAQGTEADDEVFGYQEAWADYRYKPSRVAGEMRSSAKNSLDVWHLADDYSSLPKLSDTWIQEDKTNLNRVLAVTSDVSNQFFADIFIQNISTRPMPLFSIPGLIDHH